MQMEQADRLADMLRERGIEPYVDEYRGVDNMPVAATVRWRADGSDYEAYATHGRITVTASMRCVVETAEQVMEVTVDRGRCHVEHATDHDTCDLERYVCGECECVWWMADEPTCHCPRCGCEVTGE